MKSKAAQQNTGPVRAGDALPNLMAKLATASAGASSRPADPSPPSPRATTTADDDAGRYEGHLAEFPVFILDKRRRAGAGRQPLIYADTINGPGNEPVPRRWEAWPGRFGFGGPSAAELFYELVQLYVEQVLPLTLVDGEAIRLDDAVPSRRPSSGKGIWMPLGAPTGSRASKVCLDGLARSLTRVGVVLEQTLGTPSTT